MRTLYGLRQSPWTEKARWALDHHGLAYRYVEHVPMIGELRLRMKGAKSVPMLVDDDKVLASSLSIAKHADEVGTKAKLFDADVESWVLLSDRMIDVGRSRIMAHLASDRAAQVEALPSFVPQFMAPLSAIVAVKFLGNKHKVRTDATAETERELIPALQKIRSELGDRQHLVGDVFSFADVAIAAALRAVAPEARAEIGPATRRGWTDDVLAQEYADLLAWRDRIYDQHR